MRYEKAERRAKILTQMSINPDMRYEPRVYKGDYNDCYVIQLYNDRPAGIAAY